MDKVSIASSDSFVPMDVVVVSSLYLIRKRQECANEADA